MFFEKIQHITSKPTGADLYVKVWGEWKYLGKTPYDFDLKRDRGGWLNPEFLVTKSGYQTVTGIVDRTESEFHFILSRLPQESAEKSPQIEEADDEAAAILSAAAKTAAHATLNEVISAKARSKNSKSKPKSKIVLPPAPYEGDDKYIFVAYKSDDMPRIAPFLNRVVKWGYHIWFDEGIPGSAEWDALIEERISGSEMILTFISQAAVDSRWVRREVKFADLQVKPILAVKLEEVDLRFGLKMLFSQYQILDVREADFLGDLKKALIYVNQQ